MKHQRNSHEPRQYFTNSRCLLCRGWSSFAEYFCRSGKQVDLDGVTYLLVYSRLVFHPSISSLGLTEGHEYTAISLIMRKAFNVRVLQGVLQRRRELRHLRGCWFNASPRGSPGLLPRPSCPLPWLQRPRAPKAGSGPRAAPQTRLWPAARPCLPLLTRRAAPLLQPRSPSPTGPGPLTALSVLASAERCCLLTPVSSIGL